MNATEEQAFAALIGAPQGKYVSTFKSCSESFDSCGKPFAPPRYCLSAGYAANVSAFCLDDIVADWTGLKQKLVQGKNMSARIDALYPESGKLYLVEFKRTTNSIPLKWMELTLCRKLYDCILNLVEHGVRSVAQCRKDVVFIVVLSRLPQLTAKDIEIGMARGLPSGQRAAVQATLFSQLTSLLQKPWLCPKVRSQYKLWKYEDVTCHKTYSLTPQQFNQYARYMGWR